MTFNADVFITRTHLRHERQQDIVGGDICPVGIQPSHYRVVQSSFLLAREAVEESFEFKRKARGRDLTRQSVSAMVGASGVGRLRHSRLGQARSTSRSTSGRSLEHLPILLPDPIMELNKQGRSDSLERNDVRILIPGRLVGLEHCRHKTGVTVDHDSEQGTGEELHWQVKIWNRDIPGPTTEWLDNLNNFDQK